MNEKESADRIILCRAKPREMTGVIGVISDMLVSKILSKYACSQGEMISTHLLVHQPERDRFVAYESLIMALCIGDAFLAVAPVHECMDDVTHVPCVIRRVFEELDPLVWNGHGKSVVKTNASNISGDTKKRHSRNIFSDGDDVWEECVQSVVRLIDHASVSL